MELEKTPKPTKTPSRIPKVWLDWYDDVLQLHINQIPCADIARQLERDPHTIGRILKMPVFKRKVELYAEIELKYDPGQQAFEFMARHKTKIVNQKIRLALYAKSESVKDSACSWILERFPEFASKNVPQAVGAVNVYQHNNEDTKRISDAADKMRRVAEVLRGGNPYVVAMTDDAITKQENSELQDDRPSENTNDTGADTGTQNEPDCSQTVHTELT